MAACLIDIRCLQDPAYAARGIGRHARALLNHARIGLPGTRLIGLHDPALPPPPDAVRALLDELRHTAYAGTLTERCVHVQLSPMTHDPLFAAPLLAHPAIPSAAAVYDFIPFDQAGADRSDPTRRIDYSVALRWLSRYRLFLPISADAAARLRALLRVTGDRIFVTGAPLAPVFEAASSGARRHVLVAGGADPRKNPDCAIRAHARAVAMQTARIPLVVLGAYDAAWLADRRALIRSAGGDPVLLRTPGHVTEPALAALYADALAVIVPSFAEGFSLPVIEAMAAGAPVLASDIPPHRELTDQALFAPTDDAALTALLNQVSDHAWRTSLLARQGAIWPRFRATAVADRFWTAIRTLQHECISPPATPAARPRVALLTPLPPDRSGVADYSVATCAALGWRVDLHVFSSTRSPLHPAGAASVRPLTALPLVSGGFDRIIGVLGNSPLHAEILRLLLRYGGAAILHDGRMLDMYAAHFGHEKATRLAEMELGRPLRPEELAGWIAGRTPPAALLLGEIVAGASPLLLHSRRSQHEIARRYGATAVHLPFSLYRTLDDAALTAPARRAARARLGVPPDAVVLASFGHLVASKAPLDCIWMLEQLRGWGVDARLHFVGDAQIPLAPLHALIDTLGLAPHVRLGGGFVDEAAYRDHLVGADLAVQLRTSGAGSVSGALADCIAAGLPTVASREVADALDAPGYVRAVPDNPSPLLAAEAAMALLGGGSTDAARIAYAAAHGFDAYADRLCAALALP